MTLDRSKLTIEFSRALTDDELVRLVVRICRNLGESGSGRSEFSDLWTSMGFARGVEQ